MTHIYKRIRIYEYKITMVIDLIRIKLDKQIAIYDKGLFSLLYTLTVFGTITCF